MGGRWIWATVLVACSEAPGGLNPESDLGAPTDQGVDLGADGGLDGGMDLGTDLGPDLGPMDAGGRLACSSEDLSIEVRLTDIDGTPQDLVSVFDRGTVYEVSPDRIRIARLRRGLLELRTSGLRTGLDRIRLGERVTFDLDVQRSVRGTDVMLVISRPVPDDPTNTEVLAVIWDVSREFVLLLGAPDGVTRIDTAAAACDIEDFGCGPVGANAILLIGRGQSREVDPGTTEDFGDLIVSNGQSWRFFDRPQCTDVPRAQSRGVFVRVIEEDDCPSLTRDACIASPDCALHGSETDDPGYLCRTAALTCERFDATGCRQIPDCEFDIGECYCPEGAVCACGGGPPPICRSTCDLRTDGPLCGERDDYFCETELDGNPGICELGPTGRCVRVPSTCAGTPAGFPACGCPQIDIDPPPNLFDSDCARRAVQASPVPLDACMR